MPLLFEDAAKAKDAIMVSQQKEIQKLYDDWAKDIADRAKFYSTKTNASAAVSERYYKDRMPCIQGRIYGSCRNLRGSKGRNLGRGRKESWVKGFLSF